LSWSSDEDIFTRQKISENVVEKPASSNQSAGTGTENVRSKAVFLPDTTEASSSTDKLLEPEPNTPIGGVSLFPSEKVISSAKTTKISALAQGLKIAAFNPMQPPVKSQEKGAVGGEIDAEPKVLANDAAKTRAKIQTKRRPPTRAGRLQSSRNTPTGEQSLSQTLEENGNKSPNSETIVPIVQAPATVNKNSIDVSSNLVAETAQSDSITSKEKVSSKEDVKQVMLSMEEDDNMFETADAKTFAGIASEGSKKSGSNIHDDYFGPFKEESNNVTENQPQKIKDVLMKKISDLAPKASSKLDSDLDDDSLFVNLNGTVRKAVKKSFPSLDDEDDLFGSSNRKLQGESKGSIHSDEDDPFDLNKKVPKGSKKTIPSLDDDDDLFSVKPVVPKLDLNKKSKHILEDDPDDIFSLTSKPKKDVMLRNGKADDIFGSSHVSDESIVIEDDIFKPISKTSGVLSKKNEILDIFNDDDDIFAIPIKKPTKSKNPAGDSDFLLDPGIEPTLTNSKKNTKQLPQKSSIFDDDDFDIFK